MNILPSENKNVPAEKRTRFANRAVIGNGDTRTNAKTRTKTNPAHAMIAGYLAGFSGTIVGYPLDSLKVWVQTNTLGKNRHLESSSNSRKKKKVPGNNSESLKLNRDSCGKSRSSTTSTSTKNNKSSGARRSNSTKTKAKAAMQIPSTSATRTMTMMPQRATGALERIRIILANPVSKVVRTVRALYSGVTGPLFTVGMVQSVNFATYDATRRFLYDNDDKNNNSDPGDYLTHDSLRNVALSGSVGGMATAVLTAPLLMIKINQQITGNSFRRAFREIFVVVESPTSKATSTSWRFLPFRPYGSAFVPHALSESIGRAIYVTTYEGLKRSLANSKRHNGSNNSSSSTSSLSLRERMVCAAGSGIVCWATFFPLDALRNRMYHAAAKNNTTRMTTNAIVETIRTMRNERAFYRGFSISILRAGPVAASVLPVYDLSLEWLSSLK